MIRDLRRGACLLTLLVLGSCGPAAAPPGPPRGTTPIDHVVVIMDENVTFDHYFGTYPHAANRAGERPFQPAANTPQVNGLSEALLTSNPNGRNPQRLGPDQAVTCDPDHSYTGQQQAVNGGRMDGFAKLTSENRCRGVSSLDYYDGNTVTALWNYAQHFALYDNFFATLFGPSLPGHLNLVSGQTHGATPAEVADNVTGGTVYDDVNPVLDDCPSPGAASARITLSGRNVGDLLNDRSIPWGWFQGGFRPTSRDANGTAVCGAKGSNLGGSTLSDYLAHHEPFQYYQSTANPHHLPPSGPNSIGSTDQANHQYDLEDFWTAASNHRLPAVSFLKASATRDGHPQASSPLDEQAFLVSTINRLQQLPEWATMAIFIIYDDAGGWYDHVVPPRVSGSADKHDVQCAGQPAGGYQLRCGYGLRQPALLISPYARPNHVDHTQADTTSVLRFIEDNWQLGRIGDGSFDEQAGSLLSAFDFAGSRRTPVLMLNQDTGQPAPGKRFWLF